MSAENGRGLSEVLREIEEAERTRREGGSASVGPRITLSHGSGGRATQKLIDGLFRPLLDDPVLGRMDDAAVLELDGMEARLAFTTDSFVVRPLFFPGGDIGSLAVHGTVNDLAVVGARPLFVSVGLILEEGLDTEVLERVVRSLGEAADRADVRVVAGDTKVVEKGKGDGLYLNTSGIGVVRPDVELSPAGARAGDRILVSGSIGEHGVAVLLAREDLALESDIVSDTAPLNGLTRVLLDEAGEGVRCLRDATRGGVAAVLNEIARASGVAVELHEESIPLRRDVRGACELLGIDPLHMANEGRMVAIVSPDRADRALEVLRSHPLGEGAREIGVVGEDPPGTVYVRTALGGSRVLDTLVGDALPRIC